MVQYQIHLNQRNFTTNRGLRHRRRYSQEGGKRPGDFLPSSNKPSMPSRERSESIDSSVGAGAGWSSRGGLGTVAVGEGAVSAASLFGKTVLAHANTRARIWSSGIFSSASAIRLIACSSVRVASDGSGPCVAKWGGASLSRRRIDGVNAFMRSADDAHRAASSMPYRTIA